MVNGTKAQAGRRILEDSSEFAADGSRALGECPLHGPSALFSQSCLLGLLSLRVVWNTAPGQS